MSGGIDKVIVLGGGSAGFMAALAVKTKLPSLTVGVIRSPDIGIIGVGEGSTASLTDFLHSYLRVHSKTFHELAQPTWKLGLKFLCGSRESFNYTFGPGLEVRSVPEKVKPNGFYCDATSPFASCFGIAKEATVSKSLGETLAKSWDERWALAATIFRISSASSQRQHTTGPKCSGQGECLARRVRHLVGPGCGDDARQRDTDASRKMRVAAGEAPILRAAAEIGYPAPVRLRLGA